MTRMAAAALLVAGGLLAAELAMQPSTGDRLALLGIFAVTAAVAVALARFAPRVVAGRRSLSSAFQVGAAVGLVVVAVAVTAAAVPMFLSTHDLQLVLIALAFGLGLGAVVSSAVWRDLVTDLARISTTADAVAAGERSVRTGVRRGDELGEVARALDEAIDALETAEDHRRRDDDARRRFLAAVSHDLRTPLTSLQAAVEALQDGIADDPDRYLSAMTGDLTVLRGLVEDLLTLARIDMAALDLTPQPLDVAEVVDGVLEAQRVPARRLGIELAMQRGGRTVTTADAQAIGRVVRNLVDNAVRHAPTASTVTVAVDGGERSIAVTVTDEGSGFPDDFVAQAFEHFTRADESRERTSGGAGLGLAIARGLVEAHGGTIAAAAGPGGRVSFTLPVTVTPPGERGTADRDVSSTPTGARAR